MTFRFKILGSSSNGNCALLETKDCKVLIDAGFSARRTRAMLTESGCEPEQIDAIFLTHEHQDHSAGIKGLSQLPKLKVFANRDTAQAVQQSLKRKVTWQIFETGSEFNFANLKVKTFSIPHDAYDPVGFVFTVGGQDLFHPRLSLAWATDLGHIPPHLAEAVGSVDVLVLEANYDPELLDRDTRRPPSVKQRIRGRHGHLSNEMARAFLQQFARPRWKQVYLAHLSKDCNEVERVRAYFKPNPSPLPYCLDVVDPHGCQPDDCVWDYQAQVKKWTMLHSQALEKKRYHPLAAKTKKFYQPQFSW